MSIPILHGEMAHTSDPGMHWDGRFTPGMTGYLADATSCLVTEEINGEYSLTLTIRYDAPHAGIADMGIGDYILAPNCDKCANEDWQPFRIERITKRLDGMLEVYAPHYSIWLAKISVYPFTATTLAVALAKIPTNYMTTDHTQLFEYHTDFNSTVTYNGLKPRTVRGLLAGEEGSLLDVYGQGELEFNNYTVTFRQARGADRGLTVIYGKNMTKLKIDDDRTEYATAIIPYYYGDVYDNGVVKKKLVMGSTSGTPTDTDNIVRVAGQSYDYARPVDVTDMCGQEPTAAEVRAAGARWLASNKPNDTDPIIDLGFDSNWQFGTTRSPYTITRLGDVITVIDPRYSLRGGANSKFRVKKLTYDVLRDRYTRIEVGKLSPSLYKTIRKVAKGG